MKKIVLLLCLLPIVLMAQQPTLIPFPKSVNLSSTSFFEFDTETKIAFAPDAPIDFYVASRTLASLLNNATGWQLEPFPTSNSEQENLVFFSMDGSLEEEAYQIEIASQHILIRAGSARGAFYAVQTIRQLLPHEIELLDAPQTTSWQVPIGSIEDQPQFQWRGMLMDVGRHFMTKEFVKRYIDLLAFHKFNVFHWHLTEDQGWRIEIKKYPKLTEVGAWRTYEDGTVYGGFYTQEDVKEVVAYAASKFITVVPEIELPGHSVAALASYPEFSCTPNATLKVETMWGVHKDIYCPSEETFGFLEDVLTEVMALFPSKYIHIGGDEAPKDRWEESELAQAVIKRENLQDEHELQSYFIKRIEKFLLEHGRRLIGWDEILEGGLAPEATVQSWRGVQGAIDAAQSGHDAIVSPTSHAYFDYDIATTDLRKVYSFNPIPSELTTTEAKHILGGEFNMWTERAPQDTLDGKVFPRATAMAEALWGKNNQTFEQFRERLQAHYQRLDNLSVAYSVESRPVTLLASFDEQTKSFGIKLEAGEPSVAIHYTTDGTKPTLNSPRYTNALKLQDTASFKVQAFKGGKPYGEPIHERIHQHKALGATIQMNLPPNNAYEGGGKYGLVNGLRGSTNFRDGKWQGFQGEDVSAVIDLGEKKTISQVEIGFLQANTSWIFFPRFVEIYVSDDGKNYRLIEKIETKESLKNPTILLQDFQASFEPQYVRFIKIEVNSIKENPVWHVSPGGKSWIFMDEIIIG